LSDDSVNNCWSSSEWLDEVHAWIAQNLVALDTELTSAVTQLRVRPWATAMCVPTSRGLLWFKATTPALAHESAITEALSQWIPGRTPHVLAADNGRNWLLMADGGVTLRSHLQAVGDRQWLRTVPAIYAGLQKELAARVPAMLALNTPDCRLKTLPAKYASLLSSTDLLCIGEVEGLSREEYGRLQDLAPRVEEIARELAAFGIPETLQHDDLHSNNVLVRDGRTIIFDWGDCSVSHPFFSLVVLLRGAAHDLDLPVESPEVQELRDIYLEAWGLPLAHAGLDRACLLADALGRINRAFTWRRVLRGMAEPHSSQYVSAVAGWLQEFLEAPGLA
jgi:hypothetical protein